jgi:hypothetical protein
MTQKWTKLGQIYVPKESGRHPKLLSHAANPLPVHLEGDVYRIFFSGRDEKKRSSVGAVDIDLKELKVINEHHSPFFDYGSEGSFFADGVSVGNCYQVKDVRYMLFMGWQNPANGHWRGDIGRLTLTSELALEMDGLDPFLGCHPKDPISLSYPWVQPGASGGFDMWYSSVLTWDAGNGELLAPIHHAFSDAGHHWHRTGLSVPYVLGKAQAFSRPTVIRDAVGRNEMWFSYRSGAGQKYRIGKAVSEDGKTWQLALNEIGIDVSASGWDSEMIEYPFVFDHQGQRYMLYNGNGYGKTGFGLAVLDEC